MTAPLLGPVSGPVSGPVLDQAAPAGTPATAATAPTGHRNRRWVWPVVVTMAVIAVGLLTAALARPDVRDDLDPRAASPGGSRAVARILQAQGVRVDLTTRLDDAVAGALAGRTLLVVNPDLLDDEQLGQLHETRADLVLLEPDQIVVDRLAPWLAPAGSAAPLPGRAGCSDPDAAAAGQATGGGRLYILGPTARGAVGCYPDERHPDRFSMIRADGQGRRVTVLGQRAVLQNESLGSDGNAALALRVLGAHPVLEWYLPDPVELARAGGAPPLSHLIAPGVRWGAGQLAVVVGVVLLIRGRRFGRVVTEPLPVVVRSAETVEGRARLYRVGRSRDRAAAVLRTAAARRLATRLGVPPTAHPADVAQVAAAATGADPAEVHQLLLGPAPSDDAALVALAGALDSLEQAVAGEAGPRGGPHGGMHRPVDRYADRPDGEGGR